MIIDSIEKFIEALKKVQRDNEYEYFYRGHSDFNYELLPSIYRNPDRYFESEDKIFREIIIRTPSEFLNENSTIEKLVKMQHYGLPTRLLDITYNPLVALFFACNGQKSRNDGEVLIFKIPKSEVKFYDSDTVSVLSNLAKMSVDFNITMPLAEFSVHKKEYEERMKEDADSSHLFDDEGNYAWYPNEDFQFVKYFNQESPITYLLHAIREEKNHFLPVIYPTHFDRVLPVRVKLNNNRILNQNGAFLLFGIDTKKSIPAKVPKNWIINDSSEFNCRIPAASKFIIKKDLDAIGINESTLYPELEKQTQHVKNLFKQN